jgi:hypothetical protein
MSDVIGEFLDVNPDDFLVSVSLKLVPAALPIQWTQWGATADFVTNYFGTFFDLSPPSGIGQSTETAESSALRYVLNELIENAVKFNEGTAIHVQVGLGSEELVLLVENDVTGPMGEQLRPLLVELISHDPTELFLRRVEEKAEHPDDDDELSGGLGFITMMSDYEARLGWKLSPIATDGSRITLSTMARLSLPNAPMSQGGSNGGR